MARCDVCGKSESMPYQCHHCGGTYCSEHRLPEAHDCPGLEDWGDPDGVFDSGFEATVESEDESTLTDRLRFDTGYSGLWGYLRGNVTYVVLALMWVTFALQHLVIFFGGLVWPAGGVALHQTLFVIRPLKLYYVWTWVTHVFAHAPLQFMHIAGNSIVIFFFGRFMEGRIGSKKFAAFFLVAGVLAGLSQMGIIFVRHVFQGASLQTGGLGASGAALAILGFISVVNPRLRVYLWFLIPVPVWLITIFYFGTSFAGVTGYSGGIVSAGTAHGAHLAGLVIGIIYGARRRGQERVPDRIRLGGGGAGPGGPGGPGGRRPGP